MEVLNGADWSAQKSENALKSDFLSTDMTFTKFYTLEHFKFNTLDRNAQMLKSMQIFQNTKPKMAEA